MILFWEDTYNGMTYSFIWIPLVSVSAPVKTIWDKIERKWKPTQSSSNDSTDLQTVIKIEPSQVIEISLITSIVKKKRFILYTTHSGTFSYRLNKKQNSIYSEGVTWNHCFAYALTHFGTTIKFGCAMNLRARDKCQQTSILKTSTAVP